MTLGLEGFKHITGNQVAADGDVDKTLVAAQGVGKVLRLLNAMVEVSTASSGGAGEVAIEDGAGGDRIFEASAAAVGVYKVDFGPRGYPLTANTLLNLTVDGATTQATARATVVCITR